MDDKELIEAVIELTEEMTAGIEHMSVHTKALVFESYAKEMKRLIIDWRLKE